MNEGMRDDAILWEVEPEGAGPFSGGSLTVMPFQIGIVIRDGEVVDVFESGKRKLPRKGEVRTYVASTAPFTLTFWLMDPEDPEETDEGAVFGQRVLTADDEVVTGSLALTLRVVRENVEHLWKLLRLGSSVVTRRDASDAIEAELLAKVLALDIHDHTAAELRGNRELFRGIYESVNIELASTIRFYGLQLDNFTVNWGLTSEERARIRERRHEEEVREIRRQQEIEDLTKREPRTDPPAPPVRPPATPRTGVLPQRPTPVGGYWVYEDRVTSQVRVHEGRCRYCNHGDGMGHGRIPGDSEWHGPYGSREEAFRRAEATGQRDVRGCKVCRPYSVDGGWEDIGYSFKNGRKSMQNVPDWVRSQIPKYNRTFHTDDRHSRRTSYYLDEEKAFTYRISFTRVYGGADVRVSRTLRQKPGGKFHPAGNEPPPESTGMHDCPAKPSYHTPQPPSGTSTTPQSIGHKAESQSSGDRRRGVISLGVVLVAGFVTGFLLPPPWAWVVTFALIFVLCLPIALVGGLMMRAPFLSRGGVWRSVARFILKLLGGTLLVCGGLLTCVGAGGVLGVGVRWLLGTVVSLMS